MKNAVVALAVALSAGSAVSQDAPNTGEDWDLVKDARKKSTIAYVTTTPGLSIATRCMDGAYSALLFGLPEVARRTKTRPITIIFRDEEAKEWRWNVTIDRAGAVADFPAPFARELRQGGRIQIIVPDGGGAGRNLRYDLELPASGSAIDETLTACGRPLVDPRDQELDAISEEGLQVGMRWARQIRPRYPATNYSEGFAVATCVAQPDGRLRDCVIETEHPADGRFGEAVLKAARDATVAYDGDQPTAPRMMAFRVNFIMQ
ncbi:hypothetical protein QE419_000429 [Brevundimonas vesicularis]|jgi:hypothetical protein|uniref:hypothetical protein n=1 Tax=Brevundimonas vesicularis TaxID=41276 RepID=UPI0018EC10B1|nr:hypothetical protein [Brevundimonas vesicularis]MDQ1191663.1 hypothetical protein [Brevundimonas vesicularis]